MKSKISALVIFEDDPLIQWHLNKEMTKLGLKKVHFFELKSDISSALQKGANNALIINLKLADGWIKSGRIASLVDHFQKLIVLTGYRDSNMQHKLSSQYGISFLFKPYSNFQLQSMLSDLEIEDA